MDKKEIINELDGMYMALQRITINPTEENLMCLTGCIGSIKFLKQKLEEKDGKADSE